ncbi:MAG: arginase family protein [Haloarculaceae archaeon]
MAFPGATADLADADYALLGAPLDATTSFQPGTRFGPRRVRTYAEPFEDYDARSDARFSECAVHDGGDIGAGTDVAAYLTYLAGVLEDHAAAGRTPLLIGGEHTVTVAAVRALEPDVYVCLDAHLDLRTSYAGTEWSHATVTRRALEVADRAVILGARSGSEAEYERAGADDVTVVPPDEVAGWEPTSEGRYYLSVDVDAADPGYAPGTGTMEPFGLDPATIHEVVRDLAPGAAGFDVVEVNDRDAGQAAALAAKLVRAFVYARAGDRGRFR